MYPIISNTLNEGVKQLNNIKHEHAKAVIAITFSDKKVGFKEYIQTAELKRKQGQEVFDWFKSKVVVEQKKYLTYMEDIIDMYESFKNFSNSILKPMSMKIKTIAGGGKTQMGATSYKRGDENKHAKERNIRKSKLAGGVGTTKVDSEENRL